MKKNSTTKLISNLILGNLYAFSGLSILLIIEGLVAALSVLSIVPLVDFMLSPELVSPSRITRHVIAAFNLIGISPSFWKFGFLFIAINFLNSFMEVVLNFVILRFKYKVLRGLIGETLKIFLSARINFFLELGRGQLQNTLNREIDNIGDALGHIAALLAQFVRLSIYLAMPLFLSAQMTIMAIGLAIAFGAPFLFLGRISYDLGKLNTGSSNHLTSVMSETLGLARIILGFGLQAKSHRRYLHAYDLHVNATLPSQTLSSAAPKMYKPIAMLAVVISMGFVMHDQIKLSELAGVMWSLFAVMPSLAALLQANIRIKNFLPSYEQLMAIREIAHEYKETVGENKFTRLQSGIELKNVSFRYTNGDQVVSNANLFIQKGKMTALIGESGSGKSTLTDLVMGLQEPSEGEILLDKVSTKFWDVNSFRRRIGYVPQDSQLFDASIRDNLLWSFDGATESDLWKALHLANADKFVQELQSGIDTIVGERGLRLSGGQRQRIALARAILRKPELLILDEATSALDAESERLIQNSIDSFIDNTTILVVAHRLSTIAKADYIYVLNKGVIIEQGTYTDLCALESGYLKKMINLNQ